jgi:hypothetical protein
MGDIIKPDHVTAVLGALANPNYKWRTIGGVAKETGLDTKVVLNVLSTKADQIVKSSVQSLEGSDLYTTRDHLRMKASLGEKILGAIKNRAS